MNNNEVQTLRSFMVVCGLVLLLAATPLVSAQVSRTQTTKDRNLNLQTIPSGAKMKFKGVVIGRDADTFTIRDRNRTDYQVLMTDNTSIKTYGGFLRGGKKYPVTDILRGLIVDVEGRGDSVEENQQRIAGQMDELYAVAAEARSEAGAANERISALDDYDVQESVAVNFRINSAVLSPEAKRQLDTVAEKALNAKGYMIEVAGHTDSTGSEAKNFRLSRERADAVVQYLAVNHKIPLRRFVTPMGYGKTEAVAENSTAAGRAQNRRVEVKVIINRGMAVRTPTSSTAKP